jgi:hypothetical protein
MVGARRDGSRGAPRTDGQECRGRRLDRGAHGEGGHRRLWLNVATDTDEELLAAGVADPTKVARSAWPHASSMAALMLTTEALITELPAKNEKAPTTHPGGGDDEACEGAASGVPIAADTGGEFNHDWEAASPEATVNRRGSLSALPWGIRPQYQQQVGERRWGH